MGVNGTQCRMSYFLFQAALAAFAIRLSGSYQAIYTIAGSLNRITPEQLGYLYLSFYWGYAAVLLPAAFIVNRWNPRLLLASCLVLSSIFHLFLPLAAELGYLAALLCRIATGLCQGCILPSTFVLMAQWIPRSCRARLGNFVISANLLALALLAIIFKSTEFTFNRKNLFYIYGGFGIFCGISFYAMTVDYSPDRVEELSDVDADFQKLKIPWKGILTSRPVWAIIITHCACTYGNFIYESIVVPYILLKMIETLQYPAIIVISQFYVFIYIGMWFLNIFVSFTVELPTCQMPHRKLCNSIGTLVPAVMLIVLLRANLNYLMNVVSTLGLVLRATVYFGYFLNVLELSPNFVGVIVSIMEVFGTAVVLLPSHILAGQLADSSFYVPAISIGVAAYCLSNTIFLIFCSTEVQKWNGPVGSVASDGNQLSSVAVDPKYDNQNRQTSH